MARLVSYFLLLSLVIVVLVGYTAYIQATEALKRSIFDRLNAIATFKEGALNRWVDEQRWTVVFLAALPEIRARAEILIQRDQSEAAYQKAYFELIEFLQTTLVSKPDLQEIFILTDRGGRIVISTDLTHEGQYRVKDIYFTEGRQATYIQNVYASPVTLKPALTIATPLRSQEGQRLGVLAVHVNLTQIDRIIRQRAGLGVSGETYLVDALNVFVSAGQFGRQEFPRGVHTAGIDAAVQEKNGVGLYRNYVGTPVIGVYRWLGDRRLALLAEMSQQEAFAPARHLAWMIVRIGFLSAGLLAAGIYLLARQITRPILAIAHTASRVAAGDLSSRAPVLTTDEVAVLARAFNQMTEQLRLLYEGLERKVQERTAALTNANQLLQQEIAQRNRAEEALLEQNWRLSLLNQLSEALQRCHAEAETYPVVSTVYKNLFPEQSGGLCLYNAVHATLTVVDDWGGARHPSRVFPAEACWMLRQQQRTGAEPSDFGRRLCSQTCFLPVEQHLCLPIKASGELLGLIVIGGRSAASNDAEETLSPLTDSLGMIVARIAEQYALSLVNLRLRETLRLEAIHDPLTGLSNRRYLEEFLKREVSRAKRRQTAIGIIMLDIDHFKRFNDTHGHEAGDMVLRELGTLLQQSIRREDVVCRYGGEEFLVILPDTILEDVSKRAEELCAQVSRRSLLYQGQTLTITISLGVAMLPMHGAEIKEVLKAADTALYQAKAQGRNQVVIAPWNTPPPQSPN